MADENASRDNNRTPALLAHDSTGTQTRKLKSQDGALFTSSASLATANTALDTLLGQYTSTLTTPLSIQVAYSDDFSNGFQGWQYQHDTSSTPKNGLTLTTEARMGNYALEIHSSKVASGACWARKGYRLPDNLKKMIFGCYFTIHAVNGNNPSVVRFDCDTQTGDGSGAGTNRWFFTVQYLNHNGTSLLQKWQVNTGTATAQSLTDVTNGGMVIPFNESMKPMPSYMMMVLDFENRKYEKLYSNGNVYDLSDLAGPTAAASLNNPFDMGLVNIVAVENRSNSSEEGVVTMERPFLAFGF
jgi:hypothetical protein